MADLKYPFVTYPSPEGGWVAEIPSLAGCLAQGESLDEALAELEVVERLWLDTANREGVALPQISAEVDRVKELLAA
jgi:antitoxin HicB